MRFELCAPDAQLLRPSLSPLHNGRPTEFMQSIFFLTQAAHANAAQGWRSGSVRFTEGNVRLCVLGCPSLVLELQIDRY